MWLHMLFNLCSLQSLSHYQVSCTPTPRSRDIGAWSILHFRLPLNMNVMLDCGLLCSTLESYQTDGQLGTHMQDGSPTHLKGHKYPNWAMFVQRMHIVRLSTSWPVHVCLILIGDRLWLCCWTTVAHLLKTMLYFIAGGCKFCGCKWCGSCISRSYATQCGLQWRHCKWGGAAYTGKNVIPSILDVGPGITILPRWAERCLFHEKCYS